MGRKIRSRNIAFRLTVVFVCFAAFQSSLLAGIMVGSGVLKRAEQNEYRIFSEKVNGRKNNLENEMNNIWTNFDYDEERIRGIWRVKRMKSWKSWLPSFWIRFTTQRLRALF